MLDTAHEIDIARMRTMAFLVWGGEVEDTKPRAAAPYDPL